MNKTLVILSPGFPANEADSTCLPAQQIFVKTLKEQFPSISIIVISFQYPFSLEPYLWHGVQVYPFNGRNRGRFVRLRVWVNVFIKLMTIRKQYNMIGLFSFWSTECALVAKYFSAVTSVKQVAWISGQDAGKENRFIRLIRPKPAELVAMSEFLSNEFFRNHRVMPAAVIPNGIDASEFDHPPLKRDIDICAVGSLISLKRYEIMINIVSQLHQQRPNINCIICGKGPEENHLRLQLKKLKLEGSVLLTGEKPHNEVLQAMQRSKVFLHPSSFEGFSSVCMEALYAGAHVISFTDPGFGKIPHWHIVHTEEEMYQKVLELLNSKALDHKPVLAYSMSESARKVMALFSENTSSSY